MTNNHDATGVREGISNETLTAMTTILEALNDSLAEASRVGAEARDCIMHGECNRAIGTVACLDSVLHDAKALYGAALALHRIKPLTSQRQAPARKCRTGIHDVVLRLLDSADDTGCSDDLIVVSRTALGDLAGEALDEEPPAWLMNG